MTQSLLKILLSTDNKKSEEKRKKRRAEANAEKEKAKLERKLWELAEEYGEEDLKIGTIHFLNNTKSLAIVPKM